LDWEKFIELMILSEVAVAGNKYRILPAQVFFRQKKSENMFVVVDPFLNLFFILKRGNLSRDILVVIPFFFLG